MKRKSGARKNGKDTLLEPVSAAVPPETRRRLQKIAKAEHRNVSQLVRIALDEFLQRRDAA